MTTHYLKTHPEPFSQVISGLKTFEVRVNDRGFRQGDTLILEEWSPVTGKYTGRRAARRVTVIVTGWGLPNNMCVMGIADHNPETDIERLRQELTREKTRAADLATLAAASADEAQVARRDTDRLFKILDATRREVAKLCGEDPETWPGHENIALAVAAKIALLKLRIAELERLTQKPKGL